VIPTPEQLAQQIADACGLTWAVAPKPAPVVAVPKPGQPAPATPPAPPAPAAPPPPAAPILITDYPAKGYHLDATVSPNQVVTAATILDQNGFAIDAVTGVDWIATKEMEVVYDYFHPQAVTRVVVRARIPRDNPEIQTISSVFPGANWHERETHDFFGIKFLGHPDLSPLLLPEDATFHPLRKDFSPESTTP
jgi:NADH-quinone oxidoreductase subunit C